MRPGDEWTSLKEYVARMKPQQQYIYFTAGESRKVPQLLHTASCEAPKHSLRV